MPVLIIPAKLIILQLGNGSRIRLKKKPLMRPPQRLTQWREVNDDYTLIHALVQCISYELPRD